MLVIVHGALGNPLPPPDICENAGEIRKIVRRAKEGVRKVWKWEPVEEAPKRDEL